MKRFLALLAFLPSVALAQGVPYFPQTLPAQTVVGRLQGSAGPTEAIPFAALSRALLGSNLASSALTTLKFTNQTTPATPASGSVTIFGDTTSGTFRSVDFTGTVWSMVSTAGILPVTASTAYTMVNQDGTAARTIALNRNSNSGTAGQGFTISAGGAASSGSNLAGGNLTLKSGVSTGTGSSSIVLQVAAISGSGSSDNVFVSALTVDAKAHLGPAGSAPAVGTCGTSPAVAGTDTSGQITTGSTATTACTLTFANSGYAAAPVCVVTPVGAANSGLFATVTTTTLLLTYTSATSTKFAYHCFGL